MDRTLSDLLAGLERAVAEAEAPTLVGLLADLARLKALLWQRLAETAVAADAMGHSRDDMEELRHLTPHQVGELLSVKPAYVHELCRTGRLPAMKAGKYWMISVTGLRRWLLSGNGDIDATVTERLQSLPPHDAGRAHPGTVKLRKAPSS